MLLMNEGRPSSTAWKRLAPAPGRIAHAWAPALRRPRPAAAVGRAGSPRQARRPAAPGPPRPARRSFAAPSPTRTPGPPRRPDPRLLQGRPPPVAGQAPACCRAGPRLLHGPGVTAPRSHAARRAGPAARFRVPWRPAQRVRPGPPDCRSGLDVPSRRVAVASIAPPEDARPPPQRNRPPRTQTLGPRAGPWARPHYAQH